jgi:hypothetical protein
MRLAWRECKELGEASWGFFFSSLLRTYLLCELSSKFCELAVRPVCSLPCTEWQAAAPAARPGAAASRARCVCSSQPRCTVAAKIVHRTLPTTWRPGLWSLARARRSVSTARAHRARARGALHLVLRRGRRETRATARVSATTTGSTTRLLWAIATAPRRSEASTASTNRRPLASSGSSP